MLWATEPTPTSGRPNQYVPTMAHWCGRRAGHAVDVLDGHRAGGLLPRVAPVRAAEELSLGRDHVAHRRPRRPGGQADRGGGARRALQHADPRRAPWPAPTSALRRRSPRRRPARGCCSSGRSRRRGRSRRPCTSGRSPAGRSTAGCPPAARSGRSRRCGRTRSRCRRSPRLVQSAGLAHVTLETASAFCGEAAAVQVAPASLVVMTTPLPGSDAPLDPTAMHSVAVGQDTPLSCGVLPPDDLLGLPGRAAVGRGGDHRGAGRRGGVGAGDADGPAAPHRGAGHRAEVAGAARGRLAHRQRGALGLTQDARRPWANPGVRTAHSPTR